MSGSSTWRSRKTTGQNLCLLQSSLVKYGVEQLIEFVRLTTHQSRLFINHALTEQVHGYLHHSGTGTFTVAGLEEPKFSFLYGELHILHIMIVIFKFSLQSVQLFIDFRHCLLHGRIFGSTFFLAYTCQFSPTLRADPGNLLRSTDTRNNIFTLGVNQVFTIEEVFTRSSVTAEANPCSRSLTHVTEYHRLYADSRTPFIRNTLHLAVKDGTFVHPGIEHCTNSTPQLLVSTGREIFSGLFFHSSLESLHQFLKILHFQFIIQSHTFGVLHLFYNSLKRINIFLVDRFHTQYHITVHLYEPTVRVPCKSGVSGLTDQTFHHFVIQAQIQDSIHHTRHGSACT